MAGLSPGELLTDTENELKLGDMAGERERERRRGIERNSKETNTRHHKQEIEFDFCYLHEAK